MKAIQDNNTLYNILNPLVQYGTRCHYQSFELHGTENLPTNGAYIIAPCHQQALMEPLAVLCFAPKPPVFLARADIFNNPTIRAILTFMKILPVYRIRDGQSNLTKNNDIFDKSRDVLLDGFPLCLMAEGRHNNRHHLLPMGKGMFRIAGETQLKLGDHPLFIVPTGIDFDEYERPFSNLVVNIGKPIPVQPFMEEWHSNGPAALNSMRQALVSALSPLMLDIRDEDHYDEIHTLCNVLNRASRRRDGLKNNATNRLLTRQKIAKQFDNRADAEELFAPVRRYRDLCRRLHIGERAMPEHWNLATTLAVTLLTVAALVAIALVPAARWCALFLLLCYPVPLIPTHLLVKRLIEDTQFRSSFNFGIRFLLSLLYGIVIGIVMACCHGAWMSRLADIGAWWGLVAVAWVFIGAFLEGPVINALKAIGNNIKFWWLRLTRNRKMKELLKSYKEVSGMV